MSTDSMRVVHLCNVPLPADHPDHARVACHPGRWVLNLASAQRAHAGIDARVIMQVPGTRAHVRTEMEGVPVQFVPAPDRLRSATFFLPDVLRLKRTVLGHSPDFVHAHGTEDAYALAAQACRLPYVITAQGCFFLINRELPPPLVSRARVVQFTERMAFKKARHVIAKSNYVRDALRNEFPHLLIHEIPNTIDRRSMEIPLDRPRDGRSMAFVGTMVPRKGVDVMVRALGLLKVRKPELFDTLTLQVFGDRTSAVSAYEKECKEQLVDLLGDKVSFHGTVEAEQVAEALSRIRLLVAPSLEEMFGNQFIEAVVAGADAVVTEGTAMAENSRKLRAGRVVPRRDASALAGAMEVSMESETSLSERSARRARVIDDMGPETVARRHRELYETILQEA